MLAFPEMLIGPATEAGMKVPSDPSKFVAKDFPHFAVFSKMQLGRRCPSATSPWSNAKIVSAVSNEDITKITPNDLMKLGYE